MPAYEPISGDVTDLATLLDLEELDRDLFRGRNGDHGEPRYSLYGGQVAAQALRAASLTVEPTACRTPCTATSCGRGSPTTR